MTTPKIPPSERGPSDMVATSHEWPSIGQHMPTRWQIADWLTGPTTPAIGGVTVDEQCAFNDYWREKNAGNPVGEYPKRKHTPISIGDECVAVAVGDNHKERAAFILEAVNTHASNLAEIARLRGALDAIAHGFDRSLSRLLTGDRRGAEQELKLAIAHIERGDFTGQSMAALRAQLAASTDQYRQLVKEKIDLELELVAREAELKEYDRAITERDEEITTLERERDELRSDKTETDRYLGSRILVGLGNGAFAAMDKIVKDKLERLESELAALQQSILDLSHPNMKTLLADVAALKSERDGLRADGVTGLPSFWDAQAAWSQSVFGLDSERGPIGPLKHLAKEAVEAQANPTDLMEFVDCLFLTFDATRRAGFTFEQLRKAAWVKLEINKARKWQKPQALNEAVEHERDAARTPAQPS